MAIAGVFQPKHAQIVAEEPSILCDIIQKVGLSCLKEFAAVISINGVVSLFVASPAGASFLITTTLIQMAVSTFFHALSAFASYKMSYNEGFETLHSISEWVIAANFAIFSGYNAQTLLHESGHAFAAILSYSKLKPTITVSPFIGGATQFLKSALSPFGKKLGSSNVTCLIVASGPLATLICSSFILVIGLEVLKTHSQLGKYLMSWSLLDFLCHAHYAYTALGAEHSHLGHDFLRLSIFGLHPVTAMVGIIAIPIIISCIWNYKNKEAPLRTAAHSFT